MKILPSVPAARSFSLLSTPGFLAWTFCGLSRFSSTFTSVFLPLFSDHSFIFRFISGIPPLSMSHNKNETKVRSPFGHHLRCTFDSLPTVFLLFWPVTFLFSCPLQSPLFHFFAAKKSFHTLHSPLLATFFSFAWVARLPLTFPGLHFCVEPGVGFPPLHF